MHMVEDEDDLFPDFHLVLNDKLYPTRSTEIGLVRLVGDLNRETRFGLFQRRNHELKVSSMVMNSSKDMHQEVTSCIAWDVLSKIIRKQQVIIAHI